MDDAPWTLREPCAGTAALTAHHLGARTPLVPAQGSKWAVRKDLARLAHTLGFSGGPARVRLTDPGPEGVTLKVVFDAALRARALEHLRALVQDDPKETYVRLHRGHVPCDPARRAAEHLFLMRLAFSGKAVLVRDGRWVAPGFNRTSAYGTPESPRFGPVRPLLPTLVRALEARCDIAGTCVEVACCEAEFPTGSVKHTLVYIDPPYEGTTAFARDHLSRTDVFALARAWREAGAAVIVAEGAPLAELLSAGWEARAMHTGVHGASPFRGKQAEWVTFCRAAA